MKTELIIILLLVVVAGGAFALEAAGPDGARIVGIAVCLVLVFLMAGGLVARMSGRRRADASEPASEQAAEE